VIRYVRADDVREHALDIIETLRDYLGHIRVEKLYFVRSYGAKTNAVARIHGLPRIWRVVLDLEPQYVIEVVSEKYDMLGFGEKTRVLIHELLHIPKRFTGGLRPHGKYVNNRLVEKLYRIYCRRKSKAIIPKTTSSL